MRLVRYLMIAGLALTLGGCAPGTKLGQFVSDTKAVFVAVSEAKVPAKAMLAAATAFNGAEVAAEQYLRLRVCSEGIIKACRNPALTEPIADAVMRGRVARDSLIAFVKAHPGELGNQGVYDALLAATTTLKSILHI